MFNNFIPLYPAPCFLYFNLTDITQLNTFNQLFNLQGVKVPMKYFLAVLGMVLIVEGLPYFTFPEKMKSLMEKIPQMPTYWLRAFGFIAISTGLLILYLSKYYLP